MNLSELISGIQSWNYVFYAFIILILILPFVYDIGGQAIIYYGKFFFYYYSVSVISGFMSCLFVFKKKDVKNAWLVSDVAKHLGKVLGVKWELRDLENVVKGKAIVISNHQSSLDVLCLFEMWRIMGKCAVVAKKELFYFWPFGLCAWLCGVVFIDRGSSSKAYKTLNETTKLTKEETKLFLYPEGTRNSKANKTGKFLPFKKGAFKMAVLCQAPIMPIVISPYYFVKPDEKYFGRGKMIAKVLPPIQTTGLTEENVDELMKKAHDMMSKAYEELFEEVGRCLPEGRFMEKRKISKN